MTDELSTLPSAKSLRRWRGTVPADSMSQLVNVRLPNCVDFAVRRSRLRLYWEVRRGARCPGASGFWRTFDGMDATRMLGNVSRMRQRRTRGEG